MLATSKYWFSQGTTSGDNTGEATEVTLAELVEDPVTKHATQILCKDGKYRFKSSLVKQKIESTKNSKDRLRVVRGLSAYESSPESSAVNLDDILLPGDPVVCVTNCKLYCVSQITMALKPVKLLQGSHLGDANVFVKIKELHVKETDTKLLWDGVTGTDEVVVPGKHLSLIQPELTDESKMTFSRSLVADLGVTYQIMHEEEGEAPAAVPTGSTDDVTSVDCKICHKKVNLKVMRCHVAHHILFGTVPTRYPCGFCGQEGCGASIKKNKKSVKMISDCTYFVEVQRRSKVPSRRVPSLNYINECTHPGCAYVGWQYNMKHHFQDRHPNSDCLLAVTDIEKEHVRKYVKM